MDEEMVNLYQQKIKILLAKIEKEAAGSNERKQLVEELEKYQKLLTDYSKLEQDAYDAEEDRKQRAAEAETQAKTEKKWKIVDTVKTILVAVIPGLIAFAGLKSNQHHVMRADQAGVYQDKNITKTDPKFKWW